MSGTDGCNQLSGTWQSDGGEVTFGPVVSTKMYCEGVDTWLEGMDHASVDGATMTVYSSDDAKVGTLDLQDKSA